MQREEASDGGEAADWRRSFKKEDERSGGQAISNLADVLFRQPSDGQFYKRAGVDQLEDRVPARRFDGGHQRQKANGLRALPELSHYTDEGHGSARYSNRRTGDPPGRHHSNRLRRL